MTLTSSSKESGEIQRDKNPYVKHLSFNNFFSNLNTNIDIQRQRCISILKQFKESQPPENNLGIIRALLEDLSADPNSRPDFKIIVSIADDLSKLTDQEALRYLIHRYRYDVYPQKKILDDYPPYLQIEPSSICNYRCVFCYQTDHVFKQKSNGYMGTMSLDLFKSIIDQIMGKVEFISLASRGEPFICKEMDQMLKYCIRKFLALKVNTNASLLNERHCHAILAGGVNSVVFSADEAKEPMYSQLRVNGSLEKVVRNVELFKKIKEKHYPHSKIITRISGVKYTQTQSMDSMCDLWSGLVDQITFVRYMPWENIYDSPVNQVSAPCSDLWRRMFIWHDGKVNPCESDYKSRLSVGSIREKSISELWRLPEYDRLREVHLQKQRSAFEPCRRCVYT